MILTADREPPGQPMRRALQRCRRIAAAHDLGRQHERALLERCLDAEDRRQVLVLDELLERGRARELDAFGGNREERLAAILHDPIGKDGIAGKDRADVVAGGQIARGHHRGDAGRRGHRADVESLVKVAHALGSLRRT